MGLGEKAGPQYYFVRCQAPIIFKRQYSFFFSGNANEVLWTADWVEAGREKRIYRLHRAELHWSPSCWGMHAWSCPTLCNPMDCSQPDSSVHGTSQARILEWLVISFSRGSPTQGSNPCLWRFPALVAVSLPLSLRHFSKPHFCVQVIELFTPSNVKDSSTEEVFLLVLFSQCKLCFSTLDPHSSFLRSF